MLGQGPEPKLPPFEHDEILLGVDLGPLRFGGAVALPVMRGLVVTRDLRRRATHERTEDVRAEIDVVGAGKASRLEERVVWMLSRELELLSAREIEVVGRDVDRLLAERAERGDERLRERGLARALRTREAEHERLLRFRLLPLRIHPFGEREVVAFDARRVVHRLQKRAPKGRHRSSR